MHWKALVGSKVLLLILLSTCAKSDDGEKRVVCYYTNWSVYRPGTAKFSPQNINPYLCTHLIYAFGGFTKDNTLKPFDKYQDIDKGGYAKFTGLKTYNKDLKTLLAIGGWNEGSSRFSPMVADAQRRRKFVKNVVKFLRQNHFDGLDLDWEYPAFRDGGKPRDKDNYANLVQELREEFEKESSKTGKPRLLLTMAVPAGVEYIEKGYDVPRLNEYLDFINLLSYDYHSAYEPAVNHHSPLYALEEDNEYNYDNELTIDYTIKYLLRSGASSDKIVVGIPTYGRSYTLFNEDATALGSPADGPGAEGDATREKGYLAYYEICENIDKEEWTIEKPNPKAMGPFAYKDKLWVGYDDEDIVRAKAKYVNENKLGGIMFWSIDNDDFRGKCHGRPYPLIEAAKEALLEDNSKNRDVEDEKPNTVSTKKRNRVSDTSKSTSSSNNSRKSGSTSNRRNSLRLSSEKRSKSRNRSGSKASEQRSNNEPTDDDAEDSENIEKTVSTTAKSQTLTNKNRFRTRLNANERSSNKKQNTRSTTKRPTGNKKVTTPEPPTTPDPGGDFKCEEEGFYPHPRDCKKYFWCLDSGPSGLGIVANQFTCPSGLVFNKLADSCDYPRNVVCPKAKATVTTTTKRTTTEKEDIVEEDEDEDEEIEELEEDDSQNENSKEEEEKTRKVKTTTTTSTTTARPLLYKTISRSRPTTTSTTTTTTYAPSTTAGSARSSDDISDEEQDPKVIKELIDLIKKAGGIEQLEKQLALQEKSSGSNQGNGQATPATISKSLYERVLSRQSGKSNLFGIPTSRLSSSSRKTDDVDDEDLEEKDEDEEVEDKIISRSAQRSKFVNGPGRSQFEGLDEIPEVRGLRRSTKPKYVTIERHSSSTTSTKIDDESIEDDEDIEDEEASDNSEIASSEEKSIRDVPEEKSSSTQRSTAGYVNIRRTRPPTTTEATSSEKVKELDTTTKFHSTRRSSTRPTESTARITEVKEDTITPKTRYISANRFRSTTNAPPKELEQINGESTPTTLSSSTPKFTEDFVTEGKTITIAGESGRISIIPFTTETPSTARLYSEELSSTLKSTTPYFEEKIITTTPYTTRRSYETTLAPNSNIIEDSVTESLVTIIPTESSTRETIAAVSQPRPFGFPRRTRPTSPTSTITEATRSTLRGYESTIRPKVSTHSRNVARTTTKAPRIRTRTRTRNSEKLIGTVDDENANLKDAALQNYSELQENQKDSAAVSRSRTRNRGSSRYKLQDTNLRDNNSRKTFNENEQTVTASSPSRRYHRPLRVTTASSDLEETRVLKNIPEQSIRNRNFYRRSRTRLDQQTADSFDSKAQAVQNVNLIRQSVTNTRRPTTITEFSFDRTIANTKPIEDETTQNARFIIEVTEPTQSETTTDQIEEETFNSLESSLQTTVPSFLWNSYVTSIPNLIDNTHTIISDTSTEKSAAMTKTLSPTNSGASLSTSNQRTRKVLLRKRPSTTPSPIEHATQNDANSKRRKPVRRLRPLEDQESKVLDELILHHPVSKDHTVHKTISDFMTERPKKDNNFNNSFYKPENSPKDILFTPLMTPSNKNDIERVVKVPVRFVDGPDNELFFLQIPENKLNMSGFGSVLKIEVLNTNDYNISNVNMLKTDDYNASKNYIEPAISTKTKDLQAVSKIDILKNDSNANSKIFRINVSKTENATSDFGSALKVLNFVNNERKTNQHAHSFGNFDFNLIQNAILHSQNSLIKDKQPFIGNKNLNDKKVHRQRVLIYRGSTKHQPTDSSSQRRWLMKKVVRKRIRRTGPKNGDDLETSASAPVAVTVNGLREVIPSRNQGLNILRRPGDAQLPRGSYTSVSTATLPSTKKIYPLHFGVDTRVVGITADQSGIPQNLELILADPPASILASNSGKPAVTKPNFRRKISTTISPQTTEEIVRSTASNRIISSDRRRQGHKYDSYKVGSQASYQIHPRPLKPAVTDYDYYEDMEERFVGGSDGKLLITSRGFIKCLDQGNFPHPDSCKKFISCAKMVNGIVIGTEYTCPDKLSFDPIGGICNWSAGLGCSE